jgi:crotonobetainyl-CoA:carnitine CoA-transferase CaiB-like acyl-CoA transferase
MPRLPSSHCCGAWSRAGPGEHIDISMLGAALGIAALQTSEYFGTGHDPGKLGSAHSRNAPYQAFKAKDGYYAMAAGNDGLFKSAAQVLGRPELTADRASPPRRCARRTRRR